jgi:hypothetical protein
MVQLLWKAVWWFLKKLNIDLPCEKKKKKEVAMLRWMGGEQQRGW